MNANGDIVETGWMCNGCGWFTHSLSEMKRSVMWEDSHPRFGTVLSLVCPKCGREGDFVDHERCSKASHSDQEG